MSRRKKNEAGGSLDSLLDTMTNVVGILVIVLVVTQLGVGEAVRKISEKADLSPERLAQLEKDRLASNVERFTLEKELEAIKSPNRVAALREELEKQIRDAEFNVGALNQRRQRLQDEISRQIDAAEKLKAEQAKELADLEKKQRELEEQVAELRARLSSTPLPEAPPPKVVHLPNPRPAPKGAKPVSFLCREGRVMLINIEGAQATASQWTANYISKERLDLKKRSDCDRLFAAFKRADFDDRHFTLELAAPNDYIDIVFVRKANAGESVTQIEHERSIYRQRLRSLSSTKYYARFIVWSDSFEAYLKAREIAESYGLLAGWQPISRTDEYSVRMSGNVRCGPPPPPPPKPTTPPKPQPEQSPRERPIDTID